MNPIECAASIDLLRELAESSEVQIDSVLNEWEVKVSLPLSPTRTADEKGFCNSQLLAALSDAVDWVRSKRGIPSLEQEAQALADAPRKPDVLIATGPEACCARCGASHLLEVRKQVRVHVGLLWKTGEVVFLSEPQQVKIEPGDLGTCPSCGMTYKIGA